VLYPSAAACPLSPLSLHDALPISVSKRPGIWYTDHKPPSYHRCRDREETAMDFSKMCPKYEAAIDLLGKRWTALIIRVLLDGPKRFKDIKAQIPGVSDK